MKRTLMIPSLLGLVLGALSLGACASDKPANDASGETTTTSGRAPDGLKSANPNDTNATGAATNESPKNQPGVDANGHTIQNQNGQNQNGQNNAMTGQTGQGLAGSSGDSPSAAASTGGSNWNGGAASKKSANGPSAGSTTQTQSPPAVVGNGNAAGSGQPGMIAPPPPMAGNNGSNLTPIDQGNNQTDLKITQQIRKAVVGDSSLSFTAKNVKIITVGGKVTLKGEVKTDAERASIEATAIKTVGAANVDDEVVVKK